MLWGVVGQHVRTTSTHNIKNTTSQGTAITAHARAHAYTLYCRGLHPLFY